MSVSGVRRRVPPATNYWEQPARNADKVSGGTPESPFVPTVTGYFLTASVALPVSQQIDKPTYSERTHLSSNVLLALLQHVSERNLGWLVLSLGISKLRSLTKAELYNGNKCARLKQSILTWKLVIVQVECCLASRIGNTSAPSEQNWWLSGRWLAVKLPKPQNCEGKMDKPELPMSVNVQ